MSDDSTVYSTGAGKVCPRCGRPVAQCTCSQEKSAPAGDGVVRVRREVKGRRGKTVTRVSGVPIAMEDLKLLAKKIKQHCGTGGGMDGADLIVQGEQVDKVIALLEKEGYKVKRSGG